MTAAGHDVEASADRVDGADPGPLAADLATAALALARSFSAGATMWCIAPQWPAHGRHVAVEFVHPVIVGKRALPAVALAVDRDPVSALRVAARPGDVVVAIAAALEPAVLATMRRAPAWGLTTLWIGHGPRPEPGAADHVLWVDDDDPLVPYSGRFIVLYHLLWELTHVCFEHPGLLRAADDDERRDDSCVTCSDEGRIAEVTAPVGSSRAMVRTATGPEQIDTTLVGAVHPGELVLVHAGTAISRLEEA